MTRKRFIKLLMSAGVARNTANKSAGVAIQVGQGYRWFYDEIMLPVFSRYPTHKPNSIRELIYGKKPDA